MTRLVVVSNRVADLTKSSQSGGLAVALADALRDSGGAWFGWDGETGGSPEDVRSERVGDVTCLYAGMSAQDYEQYYLGYSNSVLWPLFHYRADLVAYRSEDYDGYIRVNRGFAKGLTSQLQPRDLVWVHDYHLIPLGGFLREHGFRGRIGFFLHIPFPSPEVLAAASNHDFILKSLLQYDVVGFQTAGDLQNFLRSVVENGLGDPDAEGNVRMPDRVVSARHFPIGIDVQSFTALAESSPEDIQIDRLRREILGRKQIIGVDRLDYSKGLPGRFEAFNRLLIEHPEMERNVSFLQIAPPTREDIQAYADIRGELHGLSGAINGRFGDFDWTPIKYVHRSVAREKLAGLYRASQVGMVTPLRDGMNLVAKEYVAAQDPDDPGALVLSRFAGAADEMPAALIVNPYDVEEMAAALHQGLTMSLGERKERHADLMRSVRASDVAIWRENFLAVLACSSTGGTHLSLASSAA